jgi:PDZ domain-containing protein
LFALSVEIQTDILGVMYDRPLRLNSMSNQSRVRKASGIGFLALFMGCLFALIFLPTPYVIERPGPVFDVLGSNQGQTVITIDGATSYPTTGRLDVLTVSVAGNRENTPSWIELGWAWLDPAQAIVPLDAIYPANVTTKQVEAESSAMMEESQQDAVAAALIKLGYEVPWHVYVSEVSKASPSSGKLVAADFIIKINGVDIKDIDQMRTLINDEAPKGPLKLEVIRGGKSVIQEITATKNTEGKYRLGILAGYKYDFPVKVKLALADVGGPSGGMMFALGIIDRLTPGQLTGGKHIAGTGTIDPAGNVGPIGGIRHKLFGAANAGATIFLAPESNCDEVVGHIPSGLTVVKVKTLSEAKTSLEKIATGTDPKTLPTCSVK